MMMVALQAQFINNGATVTIQPGAVLRIETDFDNQAGTIDNQGVLEVQGNFNSVVGPGTTLSGNGKIKFFGTTNSNLSPGDDVLNKVELLKTTSTGTVTLTGAVTVNDSLIFGGSAGGSTIILGANDLTLGATSTVAGASQTAGYVVTGSTGQMKKTNLGVTPFTYPVGFDAVTYNPVTIAENGTIDNIGVRVLEKVYENGSNGIAFSTEAVDASWVISEGTVGESNLNVTAQWYSTDELQYFTRNECGLGKYNGSTYDLFAADLGASNGSNPYFRSRNGVTPGNFIVADDKALDYVAVSAKVYLGGPSFSANEMGDQLRVANLVPLSQPYSTAPYNTSFNQAGRGGKGIEFVNALADFNRTSGNGTQDDAVDWVFLELRSNPTTVIATKSAILQRDGDIVEAEDLSPVKFRGIDDGNYYLTIRHRNHLGVMTANPVSLSSSPVSLNFTDGTAATYGTDAQNLLSGSYFMWAGDVNGDGFVNATDRAETWNLRNQTGYRIEDCSINGTVDATDRAITWNNRNKSKSF